MEILLLEIGDIGRGRVADMDLAGGVFAKVVSNPVQFGLAFNLHLRGDAGVAANVSSDEVEVDGIKPDLESTDLFIVLFPFSTALCESSSTQSEMPLLSLHSVAKVAAMWRWVKKSVSENLKSLGAVKSVETANLSFSQILRNCEIFSIFSISTLS